MRVPLTTRAVLGTIVLLTSATAGCGGSGSGCSVPVREELDPKYLVHVIDPATASYKTDPPTSGPHLSSPAPTGLVTDPMLPAVQVTVLERSDVLVQYRDAADLAQLRDLVADRVVVAPQPTLPARIVVTAWTYKLSCSAVDRGAIAKFVTAHAGKPLET